MIDQVAYGEDYVYSFRFCLRTFPGHFVSNRGEFNTLFPQLITNDFSRIKI